MIQKDHSIFQSYQRLFYSWLVGLFFVGGVTAQEIQLAPKVDVQATVADAIAMRMSVRQFSKQPIEDEKMSWLLQFLSTNDAIGFDDQVIVQLYDKLFDYHPEMKILKYIDVPIPQLRMYPAPVNLYLMPSEGTEPESESLWIWRGFAGQRIYLGASALGLGTVTIRGIGFPVGYPSETMKWYQIENFQMDLLNPLHKPIEEMLLAPQNESLLPVTKESLNTLLWSAYGFSNFQDSYNKIHRTVPSARGKYPMRMMLASSEGVYDYMPDSSFCQLVQSEDWVPQIQEFLNQETLKMATHFLFIIWNRTVQGSKEFALYEAGASLANLQLAANALNHKVCWAKVDSSNVLSSLLKTNKDVEDVVMVVGIQGQPLKKSKSKWKDGTYVGASTGWPSMEVEVTVEGGHIQEIQVLEDNSTPEFAAMVKPALKNSIIQSGSIEVDGISGATLSSNSLKKAIQNALEKAK